MPDCLICDENPLDDLKLLAKRRYLDAVFLGGVGRRPPGKPNLFGFNPCPQIYLSVIEYMPG